MNSPICILVPTVAPYLGAARLTCRLLDCHWPNHPEVFLCGAHLPDANALDLADDPCDWMAIVRRAVGELAARGFTQVYLILDDQGPTDRCHDVHLNTTIPTWMNELDAIYISIRGWDHRRNSSGSSLGRCRLFLQRQSADYKWRFALHPALWRIDALAAILDQMMMSRSEVHLRTAWAFEEGAGTLGHRLPAVWHHSTYRVCGRTMTAVPIPTVRRWRRHLVDATVRAANSALDRRPFLRSSWPPRVAQFVTAMLRTDAVYYEGPYPMHFSGFLVRGRVNRQLTQYLQRRGRNGLLAEIAQAAPSRPITN